MNNINDDTTLEEMKNYCIAHQDEIVNSIIEPYKKEIMSDKKQSEDPTIYIVGGQNASGKSKLITELGKKNDTMVSIIIDDMKAHHPYRNFIDSKFPNNSEELLHIACFEVFNRLFQELIMDGYDIVIERTLGSEEKTRRFVEEPSKKGYNIQLYVTATHEINSLLSSLERFIIECKLKDDFVSKKSPFKIEPRPISTDHHDDTYNNICSVLASVENKTYTDENGNSVHPKIFVYDRTPQTPTQLFSTGCKKYSCVREAMHAGRNIDLKRLSSDSEYGYFSRVASIKEELKRADKNSTLYQFRDYCQNILDEILNRVKEREPELFLNNKRSSVSR